MHERQSDFLALALAEVQMDTIHDHSEDKDHDSPAIKDPVLED